MAGYGPTWAEVDLGAVAHNIGELRNRLGKGVGILGVVKADGYGHGAIPISRTILEAGADYLGVASLDEALELREAGLETPILIFGSGLPQEAEEIVRHNLTATVYTEEFAFSLARLSRRATTSVLLMPGEYRPESSPARFS